MSPAVATPAAEPEALHAIEVLAPQVLIGLNVHQAGDVAEVNAFTAMQLHGSGAGRVLEPSRVRGLPPAPAPVPAPPAVVPFAGDPSITVRALRSPLYFSGRSYVKGDEISVPE